MWSDGWRGAELDGTDWRETTRWKEGGAEVGDDTGGKCRVQRRPVNVVVIKCLPWS